ncbi:MAG: glycosyltransferase family 4 protein [Terriglobia bacterium]
MKPRVLFLDQQAWRAGGQRVLEDVLDALRDDVDPIVALPEDGPFAAALREKDIPTMTCPLGSYRPGRKSLGEMLAFPIRSLLCGLRLARVIERQGIQLVYINGPRCLPAGVLAAWLTGRLSIFHLHRTLTRKSELAITSLAANSVDCIVSCSQASADALVEAGLKLASKVQVVYNPAPSVSPEVRRRAELEAQDLPRAGAPIVGFVGRVTPGKGLHVLIEAAARIRARWPEILIEVVGAPEGRSPDDLVYMRRLETRATELGLGSNVRWVGYRSDPMPYFTRFDVLALPSVDNGDGVPMVALEAAQWGVPVVASRAGGIPEVVRHGINGLLVPPGNEEALARELERVLADSQLRAWLAAAARTTLDPRFSLGLFRSRIREIVCGLLPACPRVAHEEEEIEARV